MNYGINAIIHMPIIGVQANGALSGPKVVVTI